MGFLRRHFLDGDNIAAMFFVSRNALGEAAALRPRHRHHIGQQHRERLIADDFAGAPDRVAESERTCWRVKLVAPGAGRLAVKACNSFSLPRFFKVSSSS